MKSALYVCMMTSLLSVCSFGFASSPSSSADSSLLEVTAQVTSEGELYSCPFTDRSTVLQISIDVEHQKDTTLTLTKPMSLGSQDQIFSLGDPYVIVLGANRIVTQNNGNDGYAVIHIASDSNESEEGQFIVTADINSVDHMAFNTRGLKTFVCSRLK